MPTFPQPAHSIDLVPRKQTFNFRDCPKIWNRDNSALTHLFNSTSFGITVLEDLFIKVSRELLPDVKDDGIKKELRAFIGQEAHHSHSHDHFNEFLSSHGYNVETYQKFISSLFGTIDRISSKKMRLAICIAAEHYTAMFSHYGLKHREALLGGMPTEIARLFEWHGVEEIEHKAVLYNLYISQYGEDGKDTLNSYATRIAALLISSALIGFYYSVAIPSLMLKDKRLFSAKDWFGFAKQMFVKPGLFRIGTPFYLSYFEFGFHPWQHDDSKMAKDYLDGVMNADLYEVLRKMHANVRPIAA